MGRGEAHSADEAWDWWAGRDAPPALRARPGIGGRVVGRRARARGVTGHVVRNRRGGRCGEGLPRAESGCTGRARVGAGGSRGTAGVAPRLVGAGPRPGPPPVPRGQQGREGRASRSGEGLPGVRGAAGCQRGEGAQRRQLLAPDEPRGVPEPLRARRRPGVRGRWGPPAFEAGRLQRSGRGRLAPSCPLRLSRLDDGAGPIPGRGPCQPPPGWGRSSSRRRGVASCPSRVQGRVAKESLFACLGSGPRVGAWEVPAPVSLASVGPKPGFVRLFTPRCALNSRGTRTGTLRAKSVVGIARGARVLPVSFGLASPWPHHLRNVTPAPRTFQSSWHLFWKHNVCSCSLPRIAFTFIGGIPRGRGWGGNESGPRSWAGDWMGRSGRLGQE